MRLVLLALVASSSTAFADAKQTCTAELAAREVSYKHAKRPGIAQAIEITGPVAGVTYTGHAPLVIDCSLAVSLHEVGRYLRALGISTVKFSSAYSVRNVAGTNKPSKHSYGLAIDIHAFESLSVLDDYEMGLGDNVDCLGKPSTQNAAVLKVLQCQLVRSGLFSLVLSPDFDAAHRDHFHLEVRPWRERTELRSPMPAIH
jgi:hypothetical protein